MKYFLGFLLVLSSFALGQPQAQILAAKVASSPRAIMQALAEGEQVCASPPANFNPLTASDTEIAYYGLPKKPTGQQSLQSWANVARHAKNRDCSKGVHGPSYSPSLPLGQSAKAIKPEVIYSEASISVALLSQSVMIPPYLITL